MEYGFEIKLSTLWEYNIFHRWSERMPIEFVCQVIFFVVVIFVFETFSRIKKRFHEIWALYPLSRNKER